MTLEIMDLSTRRFRPVTDHMARFDVLLSTLVKASDDAMRLKAYADTMVESSGGLRTDYLRVLLDKRTQLRDAWSLRIARYQGRYFRYTVNWDTLTVEADFSGMPSVHLSTADLEASVCGDVAELFFGLEREGFALVPVPTGSLWYRTWDLQP